MRFQLLFRFLHFQDNQDPNYNANDPKRDRLFKVRCIIDMLKERFNNVYYPPEHITVDESLILFKQYIKTKRVRFGIKFFELATAEGILLDLIIYQGQMEPQLIAPEREN